MNTNHRLAAAAWTVIALVAVSAFAFAPAPPAARVQLVVSTPPPTSQPASEIYVSFSCDQWPAGGRPIPRVADDLYAATFELPRSASLEYKFLRQQSWAAVEKDGSGGERPNRTLKTPADEQTLTVFHIIESWADAMPVRGRRVDVPVTAEQSSSKPASSRSGDIRVHAAVESPQLGNRRDILVYLPPDYEKDLTRRYPVLYMHDGQNVFDGATSFNGIEWSADETTERLIRAGTIAPIIIVAIPNTPDRVSEYTPHADKVRGGGNADKYLGFITDTLKPLIDKTYRTRPDRASTGIAGSSLGGLVSLYAIAHKPDVFGFAGVISPALLFADGQIFDTISTATIQHPIRIWIDIGTEEGSPWVDAVRRMERILNEKGLAADRDLHVEIIEGGKHHERDWSARFDQILQFLITPEPAAPAKIAPKSQKSP